MDAFGNATPLPHAAPRAEATPAADPRGTQQQQQQPQQQQQQPQQQQQQPQHQQQHTRTDNTTASGLPTTPAAQQYQNLRHAPSSSLGYGSAPPVGGASYASHIGTGSGYGPRGAYGAYGSSSAYGGMYGSGYGGAYGGYGASSAYGGMHGGGYGGLYGSSPYSSRYSTGMYGAGGMPPSMEGAANAVLGPGGEVVNSMHTVMQTVARVSGLMEEVLRNFHMIFESGFGLFVSLNVFRTETSALLGLDKMTGSETLQRIRRKIAFLWRVLVLFLLSPFAGRYSPIAVALRLAGLAPRTHDHPIQNGNQSHRNQQNIQTQQNQQHMSANAVDDRHLNLEEWQEELAFSDAESPTSVDDPDASNL